MPSSDITGRSDLFSVYIKQAFIGLGSCYVICVKEANGTILIFSASILLLSILCIYCK